MSARTSSPTEAPVGRPRSARIDEAAIAATLRILDRDGYPAVTFESVAREAGSSRPALYRRWSTRAALVLEAIKSRLEVPGQPDTGCTLCDIDESFQVFLAAYRHTRPEVLSALYADCAGDADLRQLYLDTVIEPARTAVGLTLDRAIARGDLRADVDRNLLLDLVASLIHYRAMFRPAHLTEEEGEAAIDLLLGGAAKDYAALIAHSEGLPRAHAHD